MTSTQVAELKYLKTKKHLTEKEKIMLASLYNLYFKGKER